MSHYTDRGCKNCPGELHTFINMYFHVFNVSLSYVRVRFRADFESLLRQTEPTDQRMSQNHPREVFYTRVGFVRSIFQNYDYDQY